MIDHQILKDKLKYVVITGLGKEFEVSHFDLDIHWVDYTTKLEIEEYDVDLTFDYQGVIDADIHDFYHDITRMSEKIESVLTEFTITKTGKLVSGKGDQFGSGFVEINPNFIL